MALISLFLPLFLPLLAAAESHDYSHEINGVRERARTYQEESKYQIDKIEAYDLALHEIVWRGQEIQKAMRIRAQAAKTSSRIHELAQEYAFTESAWDKLTTHSAAIQAAVKAADLAAKGHADLEQKHKPIRENTLYALNRLQREIGERRATLAREQDLWLEQQVNIGMRAVVERRQQALAEIRFNEKIQNVGAAFRKVHYAFLLRGSENKRDEAELLLIGFRWLKGVMPSYFTLLNREQLEEVKRLQNEIAALERDMAASLDKWPVEKDGIEIGPLPIIRASHRMPVDPGNKKKKEPEVPEDEPAGGRRSESVRDREGRGWSISFKVELRVVETWRRDEPVVMNWGPDFPQMVIEPRERVVRHKNNEFVDAPRGNNLKDKIKKEVRQKIADRPRTPSRPEAPAQPEQKEESVAENTMRLRELVHRAERDTNDKEGQKQVRALAGEVSFYEALQQHYNQRIEESTRSLNKSFADAAPVWNGMARDQLPSAPLKGDRGTPLDANEKALALGKELADAGLGFVPGYDFANFAYAMVTGQTFFGDPVQGEDKMMMGVFAVMGVIPGGGIVRNSIKNLKHLEKLSPVIGRGLRVAIAKLPAEYGHMRPVLVRVGEDEKKIAMIGRQMDDNEAGKGLRSLAEYFGKAGITVKTFKPGDTAVNQWNALKAAHNGKVPSDVVKKSEMYKENVEWIKRMKGEDYSIIDNGHSMNLDKSNKSDFYEMELEVLELVRGKQVI